MRKCSRFPCILRNCKPRSSYQTTFLLYFSAMAHIFWYFSISLLFSLSGNPPCKFWNFWLYSGSQQTKAGRQRGVLMFDGQEDIWKALYIYSMQYQTAVKIKDGIQIHGTPSPPKGWRRRFLRCWVKPSNKPFLEYAWSGLKVKETPSPEIRKLELQLNLAEWLLL